MRFESIIANNRFKSMAVILTYLAIFVVIGLLVDIVRINAPGLSQGFASLLTFQVFPLVTAIMGLVALGIIFYSISNFQRILLSGDHYKEISPQFVMSSTERRIYGTLEDLVQKAKLDFMPRLYVIDAPYMNAFASGWNEKNSLIALTSSLIQKLDAQELEAVIAHELSHIRHGDIRLTLCVGILSNILLLVCNSAVYFFLGGNRKEGANSARIILLILQFILPLFTFLLQMYLSRTREYMADSGAAYLMQDPTPMIKALQKISQNYKQSNFKEVDHNPTRQAAYLFSEALSTHPSTESRIKMLLGKTRKNHV